MLSKKLLTLVNAPCVTVCPTGTSIRDEDGIVLVNAETYMGCNLGLSIRNENDETAGVMKKCTLCVIKSIMKIYQKMKDCQHVSSCPTGKGFGDLGDENSEVSKLVNEREGYNLMPEQDCKPLINICRQN